MIEKNADGKLAMTRMNEFRRTRNPAPSIRWSYPAESAAPSIVRLAE
jgi:hypothetical protein